MTAAAMEAIAILAFAKNSREDVRICIDTYRGTPLVDLRIFAVFGGGSTPKPTKKGLALNVARLPELIAGLQAAEVKARELGMIGGDQ